MIMQFCQLIWRLVALNLFTLALTLIGLGLFGISPAVVSLMTTLRQPHNMTVADLIPIMWAEYKQEWLRTNIISLPLITIILILISAGWLVDGLLAKIAIGAVFLLITYWCASLWVISHLSSSLIDTIHNGLFIMAKSPLTWLSFMALAIFIIWLLAQNSLLLLYFIFSAPSYLALKLLDPVLMQLVIVNQEQEVSV